MIWINNAPRLQRVATKAGRSDPWALPFQPFQERTMDKQAFDRGMKIRREVLGDAHVDRSMATADDFNRPLQELITQYCWGEIWSRPGLDRKTRSAINLAMLAALNRPHELKLHIRGALRNGLGKGEIGEILLQVGFYAGGPAALDATRLAREGFNEEGVP